MQLLTRHAAYVLAAGVFGGLVIPALAGWLRVLLPAAVAALLFLAQFPVYMLPAVLNPIYRRWLA